MTLLTIWMGIQGQDARVTTWHPNHVATHLHLPACPLFCHHPSSIIMIWKISFSDSIPLSWIYFFRRSAISLGMQNDFVFYATLRVRQCCLLVFWIHGPNYLWLMKRSGMKNFWIVSSLQYWEGKSHPENIIMAIIIIVIFLAEI